MQFGALKARQQSLDEGAWDILRDIIFFQRDLRPVDPGRCTLDPTELRAPRALPIAQEFRMLQELANIRVRVPGEAGRRLDRAEREKILVKLRVQKTASFKGMAKTLGLPADVKFNLEGESRNALKGDETGAVLSNKNLFGPEWNARHRDERTAIVERLLDAEDEEDIVRVAGDDWGLAPDRALALARAFLPQGYVRLGRTALERITEVMREQGLEYWQAVTEAGYESHSVLGPDDRLNRLPYYGAALQRHVVGGDPQGETEVEQYGRISNPTVHIGLNQLRRVFNRIVDIHGTPAEIVVELARDLKSSQKQKTETRQRQAEGRKVNDRLIENIQGAGRAVSQDLLRRLKLWEAQGAPHARLCPYTFAPISFEMVLDDRVEVDHVIPFSRSLDDSQANKVLCLREANRDKGNGTPFEAFADSSKYDYAAILANAANLPGNKAWRFDPDAIERLEKDRDFLDRQLVETQYLARIARSYLTHVCPEDKIWVTPGRLTSLLRRKWGLEALLRDHNRPSDDSEGMRKNRDDHRHHSIDAVVIGLTDRAMLQRVSNAAARSDRSLIEKMPEPEHWPKFREDVRERLETIAISHKPDHHGVGRQATTSGALHNDTAYGMVGTPDTTGRATLVTRKPLASLKPKDLERIRDDALRRRLQSLWQQQDEKNETWAVFTKKALSDYGVRRVRVTEQMKNPVAIRDTSGAVYKYYKGDANEYADVVALPNDRWQTRVARRFDANQRGGDDQPIGRPLMRLYISDIIASGTDDERILWRVVKISGATVTLAEHFEAGALKARDADAEDAFKYVNASASWLKSNNARQVRIDEIGRVFDPGHSN